MGQAEAGNGIWGRGNARPALFSRAVSLVQWGKRMEEGRTLSNTTTQDRPVCGRFAPAPASRMHLGNLWSALLAWLAARSRGGRMVLRLEDLDPDRCTPDLVRSGDAGSGVAWTGLGQRAGVSEPPDRRLPGRFCPAGGGRTDLSLLLHPGGAAGRLRPPRSDGVPVYDGRCRRLPPEELARLARSRRPAWRVRVPEGGPELPATCFRGGVSQDLSPGLRRLHPPPLRRGVRLSAGGGGGRRGHGGDPGGAGQRSAGLHPAAAVAPGAAGPAPPGVRPCAPCSWPRWPPPGQTGPGPGAGSAPELLLRPGAGGAAGPAGRIDPGVRPHLPR